MHLNKAGYLLQWRLPKCLPILGRADEYVKISPRFQKYKAIVAPTGSLPPLTADQINCVSKVTLTIQASLHFFQH